MTNSHDASGIIASHRPYRDRMVEQAKRSGAVYPAAQPPVHVLAVIEALDNVADAIREQTKILTDAQEGGGAWRVSGVE